jgi:predicted O-methyltransferase YrrM
MLGRLIWSSLAWARHHPIYGSLPPPLRTVAQRAGKIIANGVIYFESCIRCRRFVTIPPIVRAVESSAMLHRQTLAELYHYASNLRGLAALEIGAFTGAATVVIAEAMRQSDNTAPQIAIEPGGTSVNPTLGTLDIISDLRNRLHRHSVVGRVNIIEAQSGDPRVVPEIERILSGRRIGLLLIDADGRPDRDFQLYNRFLAPGAVIVCDDYITDETGRQKEPEVRAWVRDMTQRGAIAQQYVLAWGTWFGRLQHPQ